MGKNKKKKKLAIKKETIRKLDALSNADLKQAAGAYDLYYYYGGGGGGGGGGWGGAFTLLCYRPPTTYTCACNPG